MKNKIEVMELSDMHNPTCKLHASQSFEDHSPVRERRGSDVSDIFLSPEAYKATQAVEFIAEHLRNEDEYVQIREDWKYVAMVVDRAQLWLFFLVTTIGTVGILMDAPHIFEFVDQDRIIDIYRGK
jgi:nicotinic acetylcholine receptor